MEEFINSLINTVVNLGTSIGLKLIWAIIILIFGLKISKSFTKAFGKAKFLEKLDPSVGKFLTSIVHVAMNCLVVVSAALMIGVPAASFIAALGSAGLAVGLALQGSLSNLAGSIMFLVFSPFKVGDYIEVAGVAGTVQEVNFFYTVLNTPDNKRITIPNSTASNAVVVDYSTNENRRVDFKFSVAYGTDIDKVKEILLDEANKHELVCKDLEGNEPFAKLSEQADSSLNFILRVWAKGSDYWTVNFDILNNVHKRFKEEGIEIPFNQLDVHVINK